MSKPTSPLWKQLLGAVAGALVALAVYEIYSFASSHLQAVIALPTAPGVTSQGELRFAVSSEVPSNANRMQRRAQEIANAFGRNDPTTVQRNPGQDTISVGDPQPAGSNTSATATAPLRPTGTIGSPAPKSSSSSVASAQSSSIASSSSSVTSVKITAPIFGTTALSSASSVSSAAWSSSNISYQAWSKSSVAPVKAARPVVTPSGEVMM